MARGRMINRAICADKRVDDLSCDASRLAFTWLIAHLDSEGRTYGDPAMVRSTVFPRRTDITIEQMADYIQEWSDLGLVVWYEAEGDLWLWFPAFEKNQVGLDRRKEPESVIPHPPADGASTCQVRTDPVPGTAEEKRKEVKEKRREENTSPPTSGGNGADAHTSKHQPSEKDQARGELEHHFAVLTSLPPPKRATAKQRRGSAELWWNPLRDLLDLCEWDLPAAKELVSAAVERSSGSGLTIASPKSISKVALAIHAERARGHVTGISPNRAAAMVAIRQMGEGREFSD